MKHAKFILINNGKKDLHSIVFHCVERKKNRVCIFSFECIRLIDLVLLKPESVKCFTCEMDVHMFPLLLVLYPFIIFSYQVIHIRPFIHSFNTFTETRHSDKGRRNTSLPLLSPTTLLTRQKPKYSMRNKYKETQELEEITFKNIVKNTVNYVRLWQTTTKYWLYIGGI